MGNCDDILQEGDIVEINEGDRLPVIKKLEYETKTDVKGKKYAVLTLESQKEIERQARVYAYYQCLKEEEERKEDG